MEGSVRGGGGKGALDGLMVTGAMLVFNTCIFVHTVALHNPNPQLRVLAHSKYNIEILL